jgi:stage V sporulation protein SpoVS
MSGVSVAAVACASSSPRVISGALSDALTTTAKSTIQLFEKTPSLGVSARILQGALSDALTSTTKSAIQLFEKILRASAPPRVITGALSDALTTSAKSTIQLFEKTSSLGVSARYHGHPIGRPYHYDKVCHTTVRKDPLCLGASARTSRSSSAATCDTPAFSACNISNP